MLSSLNLGGGDSIEGGYTSTLALTCMRVTILCMVLAGRTRRAVALRRSQVASQAAVYISTYS